MLIDLRHAGLAAEQEQRLKFVSSAMAAVRARVVASPWDGTRCSALVANADDAYGATAMRLALKRGTPVIALAQAGLSPDLGTAWLPAGASVQLLMKAIADALPRAFGPEAAREDRQSGADESGSDEVQGMGLARLCRAYPERDVRASLDGRTYLVLRRAGRVKARSLSDLLALEAKLGEPGWHFEPAHGKPEEFENSASLDAVLLKAAFRARDRLPNFADGAHALEDWPDLGQAPQHAVALTVARRLRREAATLEELAAHGAGARNVNVCLWAFAAAGLLQSRTGDGVGRDARATPKARGLGGMLKRLARHFGMTDHGH